METLLLFLLLMPVNQIYCHRKVPLTKRETRPDSAKFNFLPSLEKERNFQDLTFNVLSLFEDEEGEQTRTRVSSFDYKDRKPYSGAITFPTSTLPPLLSPRQDTGLPKLSEVDCSGAELPTKSAKPKPKQRKWVYKWSSHCKKPTGQFRYPDDCHSYIDCWNGRGQRRSCNPRSLVFNEATGQCDWPRNTPCIIGEINDPSDDENTTPTIDLTLPYCSNYTALGYKCVKYYECDQANRIVDDTDGFYGSGVIDARMIPPRRRLKGQSSTTGVFDALSKKCGGRFDVCCKGNCKIQPNSSNNKKGGEPSIKKERSLPQEESSRLCPDEYIGNRPIPGICSKFAECFKGKAIMKDCPPGTQFCIHSLMCDWPEKIVCDQLDLLKQPQQLQNDDPRGGILPVDTNISQLPDLSAFARKINEIPAPFSGQKVRLRHGRTPSEGYLQMFHGGKWGYVCDKTGWRMDEASIVCQELGFKRGVRKTTQGMVNGRVDTSKKLTEFVECEGSETSIHDCSITFSETKDQDCKLTEDIVSISCLPDSWATCKENEIPWKDSCYSFFPNASSFHEAQSHCKIMGGYLVEIDNQEENDMLSELLYQNSKVTDVLNEVWTGGIGSKVARTNVWFWHSDTDKPMEFRNFWQGWSGGERSAEEIKDSFAYGIKISRKFSFRKGSEKKKQLTDYYFWNLDSLETKMSYICENRQIDIGCVHNEGIDYRGSARRTVSGESCVDWESPQLGFWFDQDQIENLGPLENNTFCRNPDDAAEPWCLIKGGEYEDCDIPRCENPVNNFLTVQESNPSECGSDQFECRPGECIFSAYVCDGEPDCSNFRDEDPIAKCDKYSDDFVKVSDVRMDVSEVERWTNRNLEACLRACVLAKDFECKSVNYESRDKTCVLLESNVGLSGSLVEDYSWTYFERIETQVSCENGFQCGSGKCLNESLICDGKFDCKDKKDEENCKANPNIQIKLVDGGANNEGRIEIKAFDYGWGGICDDGFGLEDANVICRGAGFPLGAKEAVLHSKFGSGSQILLDEVKCSGQEDSLLECKFNAWGEHDCSAKEYAGVICKVEQDKCKDEEWRCKSGECISLEFLCDTTADCADASDELEQQCNSQVKIRLADGNNVTSGRVEIKYKGVWGTLCDDNFDYQEGAVICRMLGFPGGAKLHKEAAFGPGKGPIWINKIQCNGNETTLKDCPAPNWGPSFECKHSEDAGVECYLDNYRPEENTDPESSTQQTLEICGMADVIFKPSPPVAKVSGGQTAAPGSQPWTASIRVKGTTKSFHWCGAVIISDRHLLTAAHCVEDYPKGLYIVRVGDWDQDVEDIGEKEFVIQTVNFHPDFNIGAYLSNDIALLTIKRHSGRGIVFTDKVKPACLPSPSTIYNPGTECTISGWGSIGQTSGGYARKLQSAKVPILKTEDCMKKHVYGPDKLTGGMFCAGFLEGGIDSCQGDSGGPMVCQTREKNELWGIISWGYGCGRPNKPGVYTRVASYIQWIKSVIEG